MSIKAVCAVAFALVTVVILFSSSSTPPSAGYQPETTGAARSHIEVQDKPEPSVLQHKNKRASRFLAGYESPSNNYRAASQCKKDGDVCSAGTTYGAAGMTTCCKNKCVDLKYDKKNCGECGMKCKYTQACCGGKCIYLAYDKSHCGACHHKCGKKQPCLYGMCNYA